MTSSTSVVNEKLGFRVVRTEIRMPQTFGTLPDQY